MVSGERDYLLPPGRIARRARGWHVYDEAGTRYLDMWQADGAALLGHRPRGLGNLISAELDRGMLAALPTPWGRRSERALERLASLAGYGELRPLNGRGDAHQYLPRWLPLAAAGDELLAGPDSAGARAAATADPAPRDPPAVEAAAAAGDELLAGPDSAARGQFPVGVILPVPGLAWGPASVVRAAFTRMTLQLIDLIGSDAARRRQDAAAELALPPGYRRSGVWMLPRPVSGPAAAAPDEIWTGHRLHAASRGMLIPPDRQTPIAVPDAPSSHERQVWKELVDEWPD